MKSQNQSSANFSHLQAYDEQLVLLGALAEKYFADDPNTSLIKIRQFGELLAKHVATQMGLYDTEKDESQYELLRRLRDEGALTYETYQLFGEIRRMGNVANHANQGDQAIALNILKMGWQLGVWFQRTFVKADFKAADFVEPSAISETDALLVEREKLAEQVEKATAKVEALLQKQQAEAEKKRSTTFEKYRRAATTASQFVRLDEAQTRQIIDAQLRAAGWEADTVNLRYNNGTQPERGRNLAIAEYPTASGPADYVLFIGLMPVAVVEAKRKNVDVSAALVQAKRYSRDIFLMDDMQAPGDGWGEYKIPFAFSSNGRPYLKQLETHSGIWFVDLRRSTNLSHALDGWYTPEGLKELLKRDEVAAHQQLETESFDYGFTLRYYQKDAIRAAENGIAEGRREMLLAMATGTGKTKTCIALIYRLLKVQRFKRILFLVDREALGEQAANAFKDTRMDSIQSFADIFGIKELDETTPDSDTAVQIATVQGMVKRVLYPSENVTPPAVDQYDCIVVDECHRGYLLDRELSDTELSFRSYEDYISKYRRVIEYFDAVKVGLTATPALHTTQIFGAPIYTYTYREAVIDGFLIDHEPPIQIKTKLLNDGITWQAGEEVKVFDPRTQQIDLHMLPDEVHLDVDSFNRRVITRPFNEVVCKYLAQEIDPFSKQKTLIFCVNDKHADMVVDLLKQAFQAQYGSVDDDAIVKITGTADKPLELIRRYKNERNPTISVTVDLLTTGVDVPEICNIVFLRRVNSRILFEQMLGRATRLCPEVEKETFRVFDAVRLYEALEGVTAMKPVVVDPQLTFSQLMAEMTSVNDEAVKKLLREQFLAKFQRKKRRLSEDNARDFESVAGLSPEAFGQKLSQMSLNEVAGWFTENTQLGEILDRINPDQRPMLISEHPDAFVGAERGYGAAEKPEDYLKSFGEFIKTHRDEIPALLTVLTRPRELTRKQLRELAMELDRAGFSEANITTAWREMTNQDVAAHIVGFIRHLATGDPLVPYEQRVDWALSQILVARQWRQPQRDWLMKIAAQTKANVIVDRDALDDPDLIFSREGGGFTRLDKMFDGQLANTLETFNDLLWKKDTTQ
ncbi:MAG: type I restriction-modification system endonuclease [Anaerolineales bacterium]|nr:type I restriction-modification system endonuclease [Anaerolineales bacterium]